MAFPPGQIMVATQPIQVGMIHARKTATVIACGDSFRICVDGETVSVVPRTSSRKIHRYKAHATHRRAPQALTGFTR
jgi:hypothetical protein